MRNMEYEKGRRLACIECEDAKKWEGYTELLWKEALSEPGDAWTLYKAYTGQLPTAEEAAQFDAVIIGGSHYSAYEEHEWMHQLMDLLRALARQGTRMYGCCFGCQILARALGGSVGPNPDGNFVLTIEQIQPTQQLQQFSQLHSAVQQALAAEAARGGSSSVATEEAAGSSSCGATGQLTAAAAEEALPAADTGRAADALQSMSIGSSAVTNGSSHGSSGTDSHAGAPAAAAATRAAAAAARGGCFRLIESHGDQVLQLPLGAVLLAASPTAANELWAWGPNVLASQFHVEFDEPLVLQKIWAALKDAGRLDEQQAAESRRVLEAGGQMNSSMLQVIKHFLRHGIQGAALPSIAASPPAPSSSGGDGSGGTGEPAPSNSSSSSDKSSNAGGLGPVPSSNRDANSSGSGSGSGAVGPSASNAGPAEETPVVQHQQTAAADPRPADASVPAAPSKLSLPDHQQHVKVQGLAAAPLARQPSGGGGGGSSPSSASERSTFSGDVAERSSSNINPAEGASVEHHQQTAAAGAAAVRLADASDPADPAAPSLPDDQQQVPELAAPLARQPSGGSSGGSSPSAVSHRSRSAVSHRSGNSSPTSAVSHRSAFSAATITAAGSACSTGASAVPFSHIAAQRRLQRRKEELSEASKRLVGDAASAFDLRMEAYGLDLVLLQQLNDAAAEQYGATAEIAAALGQFALDLSSRQAAVRDALGALPQLDRHLKVLEAAVGQLDQGSRELESRLGIGAGAGRSAYEYIASSFSRAGSGVGGVAAAAAGGCLGGGALPKQ